MHSFPTNSSAPEATCTAARDVVPRTTRVLHVINGEHYSGAERVQDLLATTLPEFGYDVAFACVKPGSFRRQSAESYRTAQQCRDADEV